MTLHTRQSGAWAKVNGLFIRRSGVWTPVKNAYVRDGGVWKAYYSSEIVVNVTASRGALVLETLFTAADWASDTPKRVVVQSGVVISGAAWGALAAQGSGPGVAARWGGMLTLDNYGIIQGVGGVPNSGVGGQALHDNNGVSFGKQVVVNNYGTIRAGGGAGGVGGAGSTSSTETLGPFGQNSNPAYYWMTTVYNGSNLGTSIYWNNVQINTSGINHNATTWTMGDFTYTKGAYYGGQAGPMPAPLYYRISRTGIIVTPTAGGTGGRGQGSDGAAAAGAAGGANAGNGGPGGNWGVQGGTGNTGNAGAGAVGGLAGIAYNTANWSMANTGTIQGRVV